jgi:hypothetical protein
MLGAIACGCLAGQAHAAFPGQNGEIAFVEEKQLGVPQRADVFSVDPRKSVRHAK